MKYYAIGYRFRDNIICSFDSEIDRSRWIRDGNKNSTFREQVTDIEVGARLTHHVTYTRSWLTVLGIYDIYFPTYDPPLNF